MKKKILVVLGSPNSPEGELSAISKCRLDYCKSIFKEENLIICTGGWGPQFNTTKQSHAHYAKCYLIKKGLLEDNFLESALSKHTVDDAVKLIPILAEFENPMVTIITSDYHLDRVQLIFTKILNDYQLKFHGVKSDLDKIVYNALVQHEKKSIKSINAHGLYY